MEDAKITEWVKGINDSMSLMEDDIEAISAKQKRETMFIMALALAIMGEGYLVVNIMKVVKEMGGAIGQITIALNGAQPQQTFMPKAAPVVQSDPRQQQWVKVDSEAHGDSANPVDPGPREPSEAVSNLLAQEDNSGHNSEPILPDYDNPSDFNIPPTS